MPFQDFIPTSKGFPKGGEGSGFTDFIPASEEDKPPEIKLNPKTETKPEPKQEEPEETELKPVTKKPEDKPAEDK